MISRLPLLQQNLCDLDSNDILIAEIEMYDPFVRVTSAIKASLVMYFCTQLAFVWVILKRLQNTTQ